MPPKSAAAKGGAAAGGDGKRYFKTPAQVSSLEAAFGADPEPGVEARNMFGKTQYKETGEALQAHAEALKAYDLAKPKTKKPPSEKPDLGMLQFVPDGFMYQKRMQGEWNGGMLGSRNYSAVRLSEGRHWKGNLYKTSTKELMTGHSNSQCPKVFPKGNEYAFENMDHALAHKSVYLGYQA